MPTIDCGFENRPDQLVRVGPTTLVRIGYDPDYELGNISQGALPAARFTALLDTGATATCIDDALAMELNLPIFEQEIVSGVHGIAMMTRYRAQIHLAELDTTLSGAFFGAHLSAGNQPYLAIIGRDFLRHFRLTYDGRTGAVSLSNEIDSGL